jgi:hypothetical protein
MAAATAEAKKFEREIMAEIHLARTAPAPHPPLAFR